MGLYDEGKKLAEAADAKLTSLAEAVTARGATKWVILGLLIAAFAIVAMILWPAKAHATGVYAAPVVVKTIVVPPPAPPPAVVTPPAAPPSAPPPAPAQQPAAGGNGPGALGWYVMAGVAIYFWAVIRSHWIWCAEDDRKPEKERKCYRPLRDGMPK